MRTINEQIKDVKNGLVCCLADDGACLEFNCKYYTDDLNVNCCAELCKDATQLIDNLVKFGKGEGKEGDVSVDKLKPCPFCGSEKVKVMLEHDRTSWRCWFVQCQECYSKGTSIVEDMDRQEPEEAYDQIISATNKAKDAWNRRNGA